MNDIELIYMVHKNKVERLKALRGYWVRYFYTMGAKTKEVLTVAIMQTRKEVECNIH